MTSKFELKLTDKVRLPLGLLHAQYNLLSALICLLLCRQQWTAWFSLLTLSCDLHPPVCYKQPLFLPSALQLAHASSQMQPSSVRQAQSWWQTETLLHLCFLSGHLELIYFLSCFWKSLCFSNSHWIMCLNGALLGLLLIKLTQNVIWFEIP